MQSNHSKAIALGLLCLVCGGVYLRAFRGTAQPAQKQPIAEQGTDAPAASPPVTQADIAKARQVQSERAKAASWSRDPFSFGKGGLLSLSGILWDPATPLAIINGTTVAIGDRVDGFRLTAITQNHVTLTDGNQTVDLEVNP